MINQHHVQGQFRQTRGGHSVAWALGLVAGAWLVACSAQDAGPGAAGTAPAPAEQRAPRLAARTSELRYELTRNASALHWDVSPALKTLAPAKIDAEHRVLSRRALPLKSLGGEPSAGPPSSFLPESGRVEAELPVTQAAPIVPDAVTAFANFEGMGAGFSGPAGAFTVTAAPPDPFGVVGPSHYVQIVNFSIAVFNKTGTPIFGPVPTNTLWSGFGGACQSQNSGEGVINYDRAANRWVISQFTSSAPFLQCVAVSTSGDPTGSYVRYAFDQPNMGADAKLGVWSDAYYASFNVFDTMGNFKGPEVCAYDRSKMIAGLASTQQCFTLPTAYASLLPADLEGATPPPAGSPNPFVALDGIGSQLDVFRFHVDFANPSNSTFMGPTVLPVSAYTPACGGGVCIPQRGESAQLESVGDRLMYRASYRNLGDHDALVVNHSVVAGSSTGIRWYELRGPASSTPVVYQSGTYAPDGDFRWLGGAAINQLGSIALGFNVSSTNVFPSIRATGRVASDPAGSMPQGELLIMAGSGSQADTSNRWGTYSGMTVDPTDDCTFWYTNEYEAASGAFNWHTRIGSFVIGSCAPPPLNQAPSVNAGPDQTITLPTASVSLAGTANDDGLPNPPAALTYTWSKVSGPGTVTFSNASALNTTATFSQAGTYVLQLSASDSLLSGSDTVTLVVNPVTPATPCSGICANPVNFTINGSFQSGNIGTGPVCLQTTSVVHGGNCGNFVPPRSLTVNGQSRSCNTGNWSSVPPARNGGYCIAATAGQFPWGFITAW